MGGTGGSFGSHVRQTEGWYVDDRDQTQNWAKHPLGAKSDLLALAQITYVKSRTARIFWENGFRTVGAIAIADPSDLVPVLLQVGAENLMVVLSSNQQQAQPRKPRLHPDDEEKFQQKLQLKAEIISKSASRIWGRSFFDSYVRKLTYIERTMREEIEEE